MERDFLMEKKRGQGNQIQHSSHTVQMHTEIHSIRIIDQIKLDLLLEGLKCSGNKQDEGS